MNIVFFGTPAFATPFLQGLIDDPDTEVVAVVCQPDKPSGRGRNLIPPAVKVLAQENSITVLQPKSLKSDAVKPRLESIGADVFVVVAYGKLIPQAVLDIPRLGCVNVHPSLLPRYRGPSPMQWAIRQGDAQTGVSIMLLDDGMDTGPLLSSAAITLDQGETYLSLVEKVHAVGPNLLLQTLREYSRGAISPSPQGDENVSVTRLLTRDDGLIDWNESAESIYRKMRAYSPWPSAWCVWKRDDGSEIRLKFLKVSVSDIQAEIGCVRNEEGALIVGCGKGVLEIHELQPEGKPKMKAEAFMNGYQDFVGSKL